MKQFNIDHTITASLTSQLPKWIVMYNKRSIEQQKLSKDPRYTAQQLDEGARSLIHQLNRQDPTGERASYTEWILKCFIDEANAGHFASDFNNLREHLIRFNQYKTMELPIFNQPGRDLRNINSYDNVGEFISIVRQMKESADNVGKKLPEEKLPEKGIEVLKTKTPSLTVLKITTPEACVHVCIDPQYASPTDQPPNEGIPKPHAWWCIHMNSYAQSYLEGGPIYIILKNGQRYIALGKGEVNINKSGQGITMPVFREILPVLIELQLPFNRLPNGFNETANKDVKDAVFFETKAEARALIKMDFTPTEALQYVNDPVDGIAFQALAQIYDLKVFKEITDDFSIEKAEKFINAHWDKKLDWGKKLIFIASPSCHVRAKIAQNSQYDQKVLDLLANDPIPMVREEVAKHTTNYDSVLNYVKDENRERAEKVVISLMENAIIKTDGAMQNLMYNVFSNNKATVKELSRMQTANPEVLATIAEMLINKYPINTPILDIDDKTITAYVIANENTPHDTILKMASTISLDMQDEALQKLQASKAMDGAILNDFILGKGYPTGTRSITALAVAASRVTDAKVLKEAAISFIAHNKNLLVESLLPNLTYHYIVTKKIGEDTMEKVFSFLTMKSGKSWLQAYENCKRHLNHLEKHFYRDYLNEGEINDIGHIDIEDHFIPNLIDASYQNSSTGDGGISLRETSIKWLRDPQLVRYYISKELSLFDNSNGEYYSQNHSRVIGAGIKNMTDQQELFQIVVNNGFPVFNAEVNQQLMIAAVERITDVKLLKSLITTKDMVIRHEIAKKTNDSSLLADLAFDPWGPIREEVASKIKDAVILNKLSTDDVRDVRKRATEQLKVLTALQQLKETPNKQASYRLSNRRYSNQPPITCKYQKYLKEGIIVPFMSDRQYIKYGYIIDIFSNEEESKRKIDWDSWTFKETTRLLRETKEPIYYMHDEHINDELVPESRILIDKAKYKADDKVMFRYAIYGRDDVLQLKDPQIQILTGTIYDFPFNHDYAKGDNKTIHYLIHNLEIGDCEVSEKDIVSNEAI